MKGKLTASHLDSGTPADTPTPTETPTDAAVPVPSDTPAASATVNCSCNTDSNPDYHGRAERTGDDQLHLRCGREPADAG